MSKQNVCADTDNVHKYGEMCRAEKVRADLFDWSQVEECRARPSAVHMDLQVPCCNCNSNTAVWG